MASNGIIQVANETVANSSRITKEGRKITYRMKVIQQPERARACGSGAKSSADRRPVDPPPIVELRIYEGANAENEITFNYNANFFLFATLDNARLIAHGRVAQPAQPSFPVLTGTPVAGMAYLDRPAPAGYFIFPDLSVRHEGRYRLSFSLYEELKEAKDLDTETAENNEIQKSAHVSHRLEVKSQVFTVFSAKKFPGLTESTALSRMVAEQGCRVRIRRDVRMRRRESKANRDYDYDEDEDAFNSNRRGSSTPDGYHHGTPQASSDGNDRPRSASNVSAGGYIPQRRPSVEQLNQYSQPSYSQPMAPSTPNGMYPSSQPMQQWQQPPPPPQPSVNYMQPPPAPPGYVANGSGPQYQQSQQAVANSQPMQYTNGFSPPQYGAHGRNGSGADIPAPPSGPAYVTSPSSSIPPQYPALSQPMSPYGYGKSNGMSMGPSPYTSAPMQSPSLVKSDVHNMAMASSHSDGVASPPAPPVDVPTFEFVPASNNVAPVQAGGHNNKRTFKQTFPSVDLDTRLQQGARPSSPQFSPYAIEAEDDAVSFNEPSMEYRRADGSQRRRRIPVA